MMKKTFKQMLIEQYSRLSEFEVEVWDNGDVYVWHREDRTSITYHFDAQGNLVDTYWKGKIIWENTEFLQIEM